MSGPSRNSFSILYKISIVTVSTNTFIKYSYQNRWAYTCCTGFVNLCNFEIVLCSCKFLNNPNSSPNPNPNQIAQCNFDIEQLDNAQHTISGNLSVWLIISQVLLTTRDRPNSRSDLSSVFSGTVLLKSMLQNGYRSAYYSIAPLAKQSARIALYYRDTAYAVRTAYI